MGLGYHPGRIFGRTFVRKTNQNHINYKNLNLKEFVFVKKPYN
jgi:hypothetical protein